MKFKGNQKHVTTDLAKKGEQIEFWILLANKQTTC